MNSLQQLSLISKLLASGNHQKSDVYPHHDFRPFSAETLFLKKKSDGQQRLIPWAVGSGEVIDENRNLRFFHERTVLHHGRNHVLPVVALVETLELLDLIQAMTCRAVRIEDLPTLAKVVSQVSNEYLELIARDVGSVLLHLFDDHHPGFGLEPFPLRDHI